jgi:hypothetical protein
MLPQLDEKGKNAGLQDYFSANRESGFHLLVDGNLVLIATFTLPSMA